MLRWREEGACGNREAFGTRREGRKIEGFPRCFRRVEKDGVRTRMRWELVDMIDKSATYLPEPSE